MRPEEARAAIVARYGTVHTFCARHAELKRSTVYQALRGSYGGNSSKVLHKIAAALGESDRDRLQSVALAIGATACRECGGRAGCDGERCKDMFRRYAEAAISALEAA